MIALADCRFRSQIVSVLVLVTILRVFVPTVAGHWMMMTSTLWQRSGLLTIAIALLSAACYLMHKFLSCSWGAGNRMSMLLMGLMVAAPVFAASPTSPSSPSNSRQARLGEVAD